MSESSKKITPRIQELRESFQVVLQLSKDLRSGLDAELQKETQIAHATTKPGMKEPKMKTLEIKNRKNAVFLHLYCYKTMYYKCI